MQEKETTPFRILSLFDGIGALRHSLSQMGIPDEAIDYTRAEINEYSNQVFNAHYDAINLGDVNLISAKDFDVAPHLVVCSSPCTELSSISPNNAQQLKGAASSLFYVFIRILNELRAKFPNDHIDFLVENVASMKSVSRLEFSAALGVSSTRINSQHDSPCKRDRYYWSSFSLKDIYKYPVQRKTLSDILENGYTDMKNDIGMCILSSEPSETYNGLRRSLTKGISTPIYVSSDYVGLSVSDKLNLFEQRHGNNVVVPVDGGPTFKNGQFRFLSSLEKERALGFTDNYTNQGVSESQRKIMLGKTFNCNSVQRIMSCHPRIKELLK